MADDSAGPFRRTSSRTRKMATKMSAALASADNRTQAALARLEALESDNAAPDIVDLNDDDEFYDSMDDAHDHQVFAQKLKQHLHPKGNKRKTRQAKAALQNAKKPPSSFLQVLREANLDSLPRHVPTYLRAAVGPPTTSSRRYFCTVCGNAAPYTCVRCGVRFCSCRCQLIHNDTRCLKFVA